MSPQSPQTPAPRGHRRRKSRRRARIIATAIVLLLAVGGLAAILLSSGSSPSSTTKLAAKPPSTATSSTTTTSTTQPPGPGFIAGKVTAIGDSVLIDYQQPLEEAIPGVVADGSVSRQWATGVQELAQMKAADQLGATVIVGLSTNGPITDSNFDAMMSVLAGASKVIFVNVHVDRPWQDPNNLVLAQGVARYKNTELVDWNALAAANPSWFGSDGTHLAINGAGAQALAQLIASKLS